MNALAPTTPVAPPTAPQAPSIATAGQGFANAGNLTTQAILDLQKRNGLESTGIIGDKEAYYLGKDYISGGTALDAQPTNNNPATNGVGLANHVTGENAPVTGQLGAISTPDTGVDAAQKALDDQQASARQGQFNVSQQPIAQQFISGQQAAMQTQADLNEIPLQQKLANAQAKRQAALDASHYDDEQASKAQAREDTLTQQNIENKYNQSLLDNKNKSSPTEVSPGATLYDTTTNKALYTAPTSAQTTATTQLDTSNVNAVKAFQSANGLVADGIVGPKTLAKMAEKGIGATGKTATAKSTGTPTPTQQKSLLTKTLNTGLAPNGTKIGNARGADGYVDPGVYLEAFKQWTGTPSTFLTAFPVKTNVNPASYNLLPAAIKPTTTSSRTI